MLPLLVATGGAVAAFGGDVRRLRPNILIGEGLDERDWPGVELHIGDAIVRLDSLRASCPMTSVDPDTLSATRRCCGTSAADLPAAWRSTQTWYAKERSKSATP